MSPMGLVNDTNVISGPVSGQGDLQNLQGLPDVCRVNHAAQPLTSLLTVSSCGRFAPASPQRVDTEDLSGRCLQKQSCWLL